MRNSAVLPKIGDVLPQTPSRRAFTVRATLVATLLATLLCVETAAAQSTIFIVRHAEKATGGDPKDPELSPGGRARAEALAQTLKDAGLTAVFATEYKRTQQTAEPIARAANVDVTIVPAKETDRLLAKLKETRGNVLVVGHSNTVPEIVKALGVADLLTIDESEYDNLFVLAPVTPPTLARLHIAAPAPTGSP